MGADQAVAENILPLQVFNDPQHTILLTDTKKSIFSDTHGPLVTSVEKDVPCRTTNPVKISNYYLGSSNC